VRWVVQFCTANQETTTEKFSEQSLNAEVIPNAFTTVNTTFADTGQVTTQQPIAPFSQVIYALPDQTPSRMLTRMVQIDQVAWTTTSAVSLAAPFKVYDIYNVMINDPFIAGVLSNFQYFRSDVEVHVRLNTNAFYAGALMLTMCPGGGSAIPLQYQQARSWLKPVLLSAQAQQTAIVGFPWTQAQRWLTTNDINDGHLVVSNFFVDVASILIAASATAPDSIFFDVQARFVNPQVAWPVAPAGTLIGRRIRTAERQSSGSVPQYTTRMRIPRGPTSTEIVSSNNSIPAQSAQLNVTPTQVTSGAASITSAINSVAEPIESVISAIQPLLSIGSMIAGLFDKPEQVESVQKVYVTTMNNMCRVDQKDNAEPLTLYSGSYLTTADDTLPEGGNWTLLDILTRPSLHSKYTFTSTNNIAYIPYIAMGTPVSYLQIAHRYWRGSMRYMLKFYCSSFISARFLVIFAPYTVTSTNAITDTVSQIVDVRGDTTVSFTVPYVAQTDYLIPMAETVGQLQISIYNNIVSSDSATDAVVDMIVFSAAGPDFQLQYPVQPNQGVFPFSYGYPNVTVPRGRPERQSAVCEDFKNTFPPFVADCQMFADHHYVASETSHRVVDILKRYMTAGGLTFGTSNAQLPAFYTPDSGTIGYWLYVLFAFHRGGIKYKIAQASVGQMAARFADSNGTSYRASGTGFVLQAPTATVFDFACPYVDQLPFRSQNTGGENLNDFWTVDLAGADEQLYYTAVRDDFQVGFLIPPPISATLKKVRR